MNYDETNLIAVADVETTGLNQWRNDRIVEIAIVLMSPEGEIYKEYETLVNPDRDMGPTRIHQITAGEVLHAPRFSDIAGDIAELLSRACILAGHNVSFDRNFLIKEYERVGITMPNMSVLCTCQLLGRNNLEACCKEFDIVYEGLPHRAISDARVTASLIRRLISEDPVILKAFPVSTSKWPALSPRGTTCVTRQQVQNKLQAPPMFLQRILAKIHRDTDTTTPDVDSYLRLLDRVLEDRIIDVDEGNILVDAVDNYGLSTFQVKEAHKIYLHNLVVHALADGVVTDSERSDLHQVARLLGYNDSELDRIVESAGAQLCALKSPKSTDIPNDDLRGKRVCFTGELQSRINNELIARDVAETLAEQAGLIVANSVTKKLDLLVVADPNTQSGKAKKARQYGTRIIAESVFWRMVGITVE